MPAIRGFRIDTQKHRRLSLAGVLLISLILWAILVAIVVYMDNKDKTETEGSLSAQKIMGVTSIENRSIVIDIHSYRELYKLNNLSGYYLLYFEQRDCPGCKEISPAIERYFSNNTQIGLVRIHIDDIFNSNQDEALKLISRYSVLGTPTLILTRDGIEISRHIGIFKGDQYEGLKLFIEESINSKRSSPSPFISPLLSLGLGILAAVSPCSLPMLALFAATSRGSRKPGKKAIGFVKTLVSMILVLVPASLGLGLLFTSGRFLGVSIYYSLITYIGIVSLLWGVLTLINREPMVSAGRRVSILFPILGMQCSFPFLLALLSIAPRNPVDASIYSVMFSIGYTAPYITASIFIAGIRAPLSGRSSAVFRYLQGVILISIGVYVVLNGLPYIFG